MSLTTIDYTSKDFDGFKSSLLEYAARTFPEWRSRSEGDFGIVLVELLAYMGDILSYYADRLQTEAYLSTATQRLSILQIAEILGYIPAAAIPAVGTVTFVSANPGPATVKILAGTKVVSDYIEALDESIIYETDHDAFIYAPGDEVVVPVTQGQTRTMTMIGTSTGMAAQQFRIPEQPVVSGTVKIFVSKGVNTTTEWSQITYLIDADENDNSFATFQDEGGATWVSFGDNLNGAVPNNQLNVYATYRVGGGSSGNIGASQVVSIADAFALGVTLAVDADNIPKSSAMEGGTDPESTDQIRANAPRAFRVQNRAVTLQDFCDVAIGVPGVLRANAIANSFTSVTVFIVGANGQAPSDLQRERVHDLLAARALAGCSISVVSPTFIPINVGAFLTPLVVQVYGRYKADAVLYEVEEAIRRMLSMASVDFGMTITPSDFYATIMSIKGVQFVTIPLLAREDAAQVGTADMLFREWEIPVLGELVIKAQGGVV